MDLKETWGSRIWLNARTEELLAATVAGEDTAEAKIDYLTGVLARVIDHVAHSDQEKLDIIANYRWGLSKNEPS